LNVAALSEGTLRYILLSAALLSPRPPELMILNEPEASLRPELLAPLARLITKAAERCQLIIVSHSRELVDAVSRGLDTRLIALEKELGETIVKDVWTPPWKWPAR
jgi:predicted ATPase